MSVTHSSRKDPLGAEAGWLAVNTLGARAKSVVAVVAPQHIKVALAARVICRFLKTVEELSGRLASRA